MENRQERRMQKVIGRSKGACMERDQNSRREGDKGTGLENRPHASLERSEGACMEGG